MIRPPRHYRLPTPLSVPLPSAPHVLICAACYDREPVPHATLATHEEGLELEPTHRCFLCGVPLLQAGVVKRDLEKMGFEFVVTGTWSAWMRTRPLGGSYGETNELEISVIDFLVCRDNWHAPIDDEDGAVVLKRSRTWPLVQPPSESAGAFHWVQEHEAHSASCVTAAIAFLQAED